MCVVWGMVYRRDLKGPLTSKRIALFDEMVPFKSGFALFDDDWEGHGLDRSLTKTFMVQFLRSALETIHWQVHFK